MGLSMNRRIVLILTAICFAVVSTFAMDIDKSARFGLNLVKNADGDGGADLNFLSPVLFADAYVFPFKGSGTIDWLGLGAGLGFMYSYTDDPDFGWVWSYGDDAIGHNFMVPLYGSFKIRVSGNETFTPYGKLNLGYCFWWASEKIEKPFSGEILEFGETETSGGFYWSLGGGVEFTNRITVEAAFSMFSGEIKTIYGYKNDSEFRALIDYSFLNVAVGYSF